MKRKMRRWLAVLLVFALTLSMAGTDVLAAGAAMAQEAVGDETASEASLEAFETCESESAGETGLADESVEPAEFATMLETAAESKLDEESEAVRDISATEETEETRLSEETRAFIESGEAKATEETAETKESGFSEETAETGEPVAEVGTGEGTSLPKMSKKSALKSSALSGTIPSAGTCRFAAWGCR